VFFSKIWNAVYMAWVYILISRKNNRYYIGSTSDLKRRLFEHTNGYSKATRYLRPLEVAFTKEFPVLQEARQEERRLKRLKRKDYIDLYISG